MIKTPRGAVAFPAVFLCIAIIAAGCGSAWRAPLFQKRGFQMQWVDQITILPTVDARIDRSIEVKLDEQLRDASVKILTKKGYATVVGHLNDARSSMTIDDLTDPDAAWIEQLGPPEARWLLIVSLLDVTASFVFLGSTGNAEVAGFLYDTKDGTLAWRDKGAAQVGQGGMALIGGVIGMALKGAMADAAIDEALDHLFASFPQRTKDHPYLPEPSRTATPDQTPTSIP